MNSIMWAKLKEYLLTKNSHGKNELLNEMVKLEIACANEIFNRNVPVSLPPYVKLGSSALRYDEVFNNYYRDAGDWSVGYIVVDNKLLSNSNIPHLHRQPLIEITYDEWLEDTTTNNFKLRK